MSAPITNSSIKDYLNSIRVGDVVRVVGRHFATALGTIAIVWGFGKPYVDSYIKSAIAQDYASQGQMRSVESSIKDVEKSVSIIADKLPSYEEQFRAIQMDQVRTKIIADETRTLVRQSQEGIGELNRDFKSMLRDFRSVNNIPPYVNSLVPMNPVTDATKMGN